jgi:hypothetical protein
MDQIGQKQKANEQTASSHGQRTVSAREIPLHRDLFGVATPVRHRTADGACALLHSQEQVQPGAVTEPQTDQVQEEVAGGESFTYLPSSPPARSPALSRCRVNWRR